MSKYVVIGIVLALVGLTFINLISNVGEAGTTERS